MYIFGKIYSLSITCSDNALYSMLQKRQADGSTKSHFALRPCMSWQTGIIAAPPKAPPSCS